MPKTSAFRRATSRTISLPQSRSQPEFFVDRSLARHALAEGLRRQGVRLRTHFEVYGDRDQEVLDVEWLELCGREGLVVLTMDRRIRYHRAEIAALRRHRVKAFVLASGNLSAAEQAERFIVNRQRIEAACDAEGPFIYAVHAGTIVRIFPS